MRKNPYPQYTDCDDAMASLLAEIQNEDVDVLKDEIIGLAEQSLDDRFLEVYGEQISEPNLRELKRGLKNIRTIDQLEEYVDTLINRNFWGSSYTRLLPSRFTVSDVQIRENFKCVHYTNMDFRFSKDIKKDLAGRATPSRLMMTGSQVDFELQGNGYIFAYPSRDVQERSWVRDFSWAQGSKYIITLDVSKCVSFYHKYDNDIQCIVPVLCINSASFSRNPDYAWPEMDYHFDTPEEYEDFLESRTPRARLSPDAKEVIVKCIECKERFTRHPLKEFKSSRAGRFKVSDEYVCSLCKDDYDTYVSELESYPIIVYPVDGVPYRTKVKFFSELQDIAEKSIGIRHLNVLMNDGTEMLLNVDADPKHYSPDFVSKHTNPHFIAAEPILGSVIQISVEGLDALEYKDPR